MRLVSIPAFYWPEECFTDGLKGCARHINFLFLLLTAGLIIRFRHSYHLCRCFRLTLRFSHFVTSDCSVWVLCSKNYITRVEQAVYACQRILRYCNIFLIPTSHCPQCKHDDGKNDSNTDRPDGPVSLPPGLHIIIRIFIHIRRPVSLSHTALHDWLSHHSTSVHTQPAAHSRFT